MVIFFSILEPVLAVLEQLEWGMWLILLNNGGQLRETWRMAAIRLEVAA